MLQQIRLANVQSERDDLREDLLPPWRGPRVLLPWRQGLRLLLVVVLAVVVVLVVTVAPMVLAVVVFARVTDVLGLTLVVFLSVYCLPCP